MDHLPGKPLRILILEDEPDAAELVERKLRKAGIHFTALRAETRAQFLAAIEGTGADLLLADFNLPDITGLDAIRIIRERGLDLPTILVTGSQGEDIAVECIREGAFDYILKDRMERLPTAVERVLAHLRAEREKRDALSALEESEWRYRDLADNLPEIIFEADLRGRLTYVNRSAFVLTGFTQADLDRGVNLVEIVAPGDRDRARDRMRRLLAGEEIGIQEYSLLRADGSVYLAMIHSRPITRDGAAAGFRGIVMDITERKRAEDALRESEARFRNLFEQNLAGVYRSTLDGRLLEANEAMARIYGYGSPQEILAQTAEALYLSPRDREQFLAALKKEKTLSNVETEGRKKSGERIHLLENVAWIEDSGIGMPVIEGTLFDISERKRVEESLREREVMFRTLAEGMNEGLMRVDPDDVILYVNPRLCQMLDYSEAEMIGRAGFSFLIPEEERAVILQENEERKQGLSNRYESRMVKKSGMILSVEISGSPVLGPGGKPVGSIGLITDITERRRVEESVRDLQAQFLQSQKMEAVGRLAGGIAHDFNNILTTILTNGELTAERLEADSPARKNLEQIQTAALRAADLTRQLLAYSRQQVFEMKTTDLKRALESTLKLFSRVLGEAIRVEVQLEEGLRPILGDAGQLEQIIMNLVVNAKDAMESGGRLSIRLFNAPAATLPEGADAGPEIGPSVVLEVKDTGVGMSPEVMARIFDPYFTTKGREKGTGLGLAVVEGIVKQHGGTIEVSSEKGLGTTFTVRFPADLGPLPTLRPELNLPNRRGTEKLLLVEDEEGVREAIQETLQSLGYRVLTANHAAGAMEVFEEHGDSIHLVLSDMIMPGNVTGRTLCEDLKRRRPGLKTLVMSGHADDILLKEGVSLGEVAFIQKPFSRMSLAAKIREILDG